MSLLRPRVLIGLRMYRRRYNLASSAEQLAGFMPDSLDDEQVRLLPPSFRFHHIKDRFYVTVVSVCLLRMLIPLCVPSPYVINLLRNLAPKRGFVNGTRLIVVHLRQRVIQARILTGTRSGRLVLIPRIRCNPSEHDLPFELIRLQFPIRPAFAMSINKSQGQTFTKVDIYLPTFVFSHGQGMSQFPVSVLRMVFS